MSACTITISNGPAFTRTFGSDPYRKHLVNAVSNCFDGAAVHSTAYAHDLLSRRTNILYTAQSGTNTLACSYNARSEVTGVSIDTNDYAYIYDNIGNNLYTSLNTVTNAYTVNNLNQYNAITNLFDLSGYRVQHDADGNMVRLDDHILAYDAENRLATYTFGIGSSTGMLRTAYNYDHLGRRVKKMNQESKQKNPGGFVPLTYWHTNEVATFVYDGWNLIHERVAHTNGTVDEMEYVWGLDLSGTLQGAGGVGGLLFEKRNGEIYIPCYDANGNITTYVDTNGTVRAYRVFDAFGNTIDKGGDMADVFHFWFSTKFLDHDTGLYYYGYRYYSPLLQRWINRDPIEESGGMNLYGFVTSDPINRFDSLGLFDVPNAWFVRLWQHVVPGAIMNQVNFMLFVEFRAKMAGTDPWLPKLLALYFFGDGSKTVRLTEGDVGQIDSPDPALFNYSEEFSRRYKDRAFSVNRIIPETKSNRRFQVLGKGKGNDTLGHFDVYYKGEVKNCTFKGHYKISDEFKFNWDFSGGRSVQGETFVWLFTLMSMGSPFKVESEWIPKVERPGGRRYE